MLFRSRSGLADQPSTVRCVETAKSYRIIAGERRYTAARNAGLTEMPCWVKTPKHEEILRHQIVENWQRADLNPFELADSLAVLQDANRYTQADLATATGKSQGDVSKPLTILDLDPDVQKIAHEPPASTTTPTPRSPRRSSRPCQRRPPKSCPPRRNRSGPAPEYTPASARSQRLDPPGRLPAQEG